MNKIKYDPSINTLSSDRHLWSLCQEGISGVIREGVAPTLNKAMKEIRAAKKWHKNQLAAPPAEIVI